MFHKYIALEMFTFMNIEEDAMRFRKRKQVNQKRKMIIAPLIIILVFGLSASAQENRDNAKSQPTQRPIITTNQIYEKYKDKIYTVTGDNSLGTGFSWFNFGILTCFHVVTGCSSATASRSGLKNALMLNRVVTFDKDLDAIVFLVNEHNGEIPRGKSSELKIGDKLVVIGSPQGLEQSVSEGILSGRRKVESREYLQLSVPISPGSSGSPVFNKYGEAVGMITASIREGQQLNFALSIDSIIDMSPGVPLDSILGNATPKMIPVSSIETGTKKLAGSPEFVVLVESLPERLKWSISVTQVRQWIEAELARSAPTAVALSFDAQQKKVTSLRDGMLGGMDAASKFLLITINYVRTDLGISFYSIRMEFNRPAITVIGLSFSPAWESSVGGYFGSSYSVSDKIRDAVQGITREFAAQWVEDNKNI